MMKKTIAVLLAFMSISLAGFGDVLLWQVTESTLVDGGSIQQFLVPYPSTDDSWPAARVKLVTVDGSSKILPIYGGGGVWEDGDWGREIVDWEGGWGTGVPTGNQSETSFNTISTIQDILHGNVIEPNLDALESLLVMELGYNSWDDDAGDFVWQTLAKSAPEVYKDLVDRYMYASGNTAPSTLTSWSPNFYTVPEPSSALFCIFGIGLLMLTRRVD